MFDKSYVISMMIDMLKQEIIPDLKSSAAKEQVIAIISVLKNLNANTVVNQDRYETVNLLIVDGVTQIANDIGKDSNLFGTNLSKWAKNLPEEMVYLKSAVKTPFEQWEELNQVLCKLIELLYVEEFIKIEGYMDRARNLLREQLQNEIKSVY